MTEARFKAAMADAIGAIWKAAGDRSLWPEAIRSVQTLMPECIGGAVQTPLAQGPGAFWEFTNPPPGYIENYVQNWMARDPLLVAGARRLPCEAFVYDLDDYIPPERASSTPIYQELLLPYGLADFTGAAVNGGLADGGGSRLMFMTLMTERRNARESKRRRRIFETLTPHLLGAARLHWRLFEAESKAAAAQSIMDRIAPAILLLDVNGRILQSNHAADRQLAAGDAIEARGGRLLPRRNAAAFSAALAKVAAGGAESAFPLPRPGKPALAAILAPAAALGQGISGIVLFLCDPQIVPADAGSRLGAMLGLSKAEAEIAQALTSGASPQEIAELRQASLHTVRTQIKSLMRKLNASRQSEVVRAVMAVSLLDPRTA